jgi:hypothetical protein
LLGFLIKIIPEINYHEVKHKSFLAYPNLFGIKGFVVVVEVKQKPKLHRMKRIFFKLLAALWGGELFPRS